MSHLVMDKTALLTQSNGSIYHLALLPDELASTVILVGDPGRVPLVSRHFDRITTRKSHREFVTHTGWYQGHRLSVLSSGIGSGGIDIVMNELDALVNIDFNTRTVKQDFQQLTILRLGTCGAIHPNVLPGETILSNYAVGMDGVLNSYVAQPTRDERELLSAVQTLLPSSISQCLYAGSSSLSLLQYFSEVTHRGLTLTCPSFFGGQGRRLRLPLSMPNMIADLATFQFQHQVFLNLEMETALIFALGHALGHRVASISTAINNRITGEVLSEIPQAIDNMIEQALSQLSAGLLE